MSLTNAQHIFFDKAMQAKLGVDELFFSALNADNGDPINFPPTLNCKNGVKINKGCTQRDEKQVYSFPIWTP